MVHIRANDIWLGGNAIRLGRNVIRLGGLHVTYRVSIPLQFG
jgi:hypothetical protein